MSAPVLSLELRQQLRFLFAQRPRRQQVGPPEPSPPQRAARRGPPARAGPSGARDLALATGVGAARARPPRPARARRRELRAPAPAPGVPARRAPTSPPPHGPPPRAGAQD